MIHHVGSQFSSDVDLPDVQSDARIQRRGRHTRAKCRVRAASKSTERGQGEPRVFQVSDDLASVYRSRPHSPLTVTGTADHA